MLASYRVHEMRVTRCANAGPVSLAHKGLPLPHCMQDILPSNLNKNFSYLAFWRCSITASHSKTVSQSLYDTISTDQSVGVKSHKLSCPYRKETVCTCEDKEPRFRHAWRSVSILLLV